MIISRLLLENQDSEAVNLKEKKQLFGSQYLRKHGLNFAETMRILSWELLIWALSIFVEYHQLLTSIKSTRINVIFFSLFYKELKTRNIS